jgi:hypothetical protein
MAKDILRNDINDLLEMIRDQYNIISRYEGKIPQIEMDIIMTNIRRLYDDFFELNKLNQKYKADPEQEDIARPEPARETFTKSAAIEHPHTKQNEEKIMPAREEKPEEVPPVEEQPLIIQIEPQIKISKEIVKPKETTKPQQKKVPVADLFAETGNHPLAEKFKDEKKSLHDSLVIQKKEKTIADTILNPIADLRTGIGVNDRFLFINELFKGNMQEYSAAIEEINDQASGDHAIQRIISLKEQYQWKDDSEALTRLLGFVARRFR